MDGRHRDLDRLIGPVVFHRLPMDLLHDRHIADYVERRLFVDLSPEEQGRYDLLMAEFRWYLAKQQIPPARTSSASWSAAPATTRPRATRSSPTIRRA